MSDIYASQIQRAVDLTTLRHKTWAGLGFGQGFFNLSFTACMNSRAVPKYFLATKLFSNLNISNSSNEAELVDQLNFIDLLSERVHQEQLRLMDIHQKSTRRGYIACMLSLLTLLAITMVTTLYASELIACVMFIMCICTYQIAGWRSCQRRTSKMQETSDADPKTYLPWFANAGN